MKARALKTAVQGGAGGVLSAGVTKQNFDEPMSKSQTDRSLLRHPGRNLNPAVKAWIDNVIVPALTEEWIKEQRV
jgi:hypothetical protein